MQALDYLSPHAAPSVGWLANRLYRWHAWTAIGLWATFSVLTLIIVMNGLDRATERPRTVLATTAATALGPMTGAVSRDFQGCCVDFSVSLLPYCLVGLLTGMALQLIVPARGPASGAVRAVAWVTGWVIWFGGGIVSFGHALF
jgi:hypothetical protein